MAGAKRQTREDGEAYATPVIGSYGECGYCGNPLVLRAEGRPPKYCGTACRAGAHRHSRPTGKVKRGQSGSQKL